MDEAIDEALIEAVAIGLWRAEVYEFGGPEWGELLKTETFRPGRFRALARAAILARDAHLQAAAS